MEQNGWPWNGLALFLPCKFFCIFETYKGKYNLKPPNEEVNRIIKFSVAELFKENHFVHLI